MNLIISVEKYSKSNKAEAQHKMFTTTLSLFCLIGKPEPELKDICNPFVT